MNKIEAILGVTINQRNGAMDACADAVAEAALRQKTIEEHYKLLAQIVRSDQMPHEDVQKLILQNPEFAAWYSKTYPSAGV